LLRLRRVIVLLSPEFSKVFDRSSCGTAAHEWDPQSAASSLQTT